MGERGEAGLWVCGFAFLLVMVAASLRLPLCCAVLSLITGFSHSGHWQLRPECCFCHSHPLGCSLTPPLWLYQLGPWQVPDSFCGPCLFLSPIPASFACSGMPAFGSLDLWISDVPLCWAENPMLNSSCPTCNFKGRNKGVFLLCHDAYITVEST